MISLDNLASLGAHVAKALGIATAVGSTYIALGLPMPATVAYVDGKISTVIDAVADVKSTVLEGRLLNITTQRALLRNEKVALTRAIEKAPESAKSVLIRRLGEIEDALGRLSREEDAVSVAMSKKDSK